MPTKHIRHSRPHFLNAYGAAIFWAAFILLLMSLPGKDLPDFDIWAINIEDKLGHIAVFGLLSCLMVWGLVRRMNSVNRKSFWCIFLLVTLYGAATEILQGVAFPTRFASVSDFIADAIGAGLGIVFAIIILHKLRRQKS